MTQESKSVTVNAATLREALNNVSPHAGRDTHLPVLNAVKLESDGLTVTLVATDRFTLAAQTLDTLTPGDELAVLLDLGDVAKIAAACKDVPKNMSEWPVKITAAGDVVTVSVEYAGTQLRCVQVPGDFPKWRTLLDHAREQATSDENTVGRIAVNPQLLAKFAKTTVEGRKANTMRMHFTSPTSPIVITIGETFRAIQMPIRQDWPEVTAQPATVAAATR